MATSPLSISKAVKAEATRQALIRAARELFGEQGYAATSVDEIARQAGVTKGALYHHFRDKDDLFRAVVEDVKRDVTDVVGAAFLTATAPRTRPWRTSCSAAGPSSRRTSTRPCSASASSTPGRCSTPPPGGRSTPATR